MQAGDVSSSPLRYVTTTTTSSSSMAVSPSASYNDYKNFLVDLNTELTQLSRIEVGPHWWTENCIFVCDEFYNLKDASLKVISMANSVLAINNQDISDQLAVAVVNLYELCNGLKVIQEKEYLVSETSFVQSSVPLEVDEEDLSSEESPYDDSLIEKEGKGRKDETDLNKISMQLRSLRDQINKRYQVHSAQEERISLSQLGGEGDEEGVDTEDFVLVPREESSYEIDYLAEVNRFLQQKPKEEGS